MGACWCCVGRPKPESGSTGLDGCGGVGCLGSWLGPFVERLENMSARPDEALGAGGTEEPAAKDWCFS